MSKRKSSDYMGSEIESETPYPHKAESGKTFDTKHVDVKCTCPDPDSLPIYDMDGSFFVAEPCDWCVAQHRITEDTEYYYDKMSK